MRKLGQTIATMARYRRHWSTLLQTTGAHRATAEPGASSDHLTELTGFGSNPGALRMFTHAPKNLGPSPALVVVLHGCTQSAGSYDLGAGWSTLADRYGFVLLLRRTDAGEQSEDLLQLVPARRHRARPGRGAVDPPDDREDDRRARHRPRPRVHHRALGRRRDGGGDARHLPGSVFGRRDHCGSALRRGRQRAAGLREHVPGPAAQRAGMGRSGAARFEASRAVAARLGVARRRRRDRGADERRRPRSAMDRRARHRGGAGRRPDQRPCAQGLAPRRDRRRRVLHHHRHGARHAARDRHRGGSLRQGRAVPARGGNLVVLSHREILRPDRRRRAQARRRARPRQPSARRSRRTIRSRSFRTSASRSSERTAAGSKIRADR